MSNVMFGRPNRVLDATYSGGDWSTTLPLSFLNEEALDAVARASINDPRASFFYASKTSAIAAGVMSLFNHNFTTSGTYRLRTFAASPVPLSRMNGVIGASPFTFTRAGSVQARNASGTLTTYGNDVAVIDRHPSTLRRLGLLHEAGVTNYFKYSRTLDASSWTQQNCTVGSAAGIGGGSCSRVTATSTNARVFMTTGTASQPMTVSFWVKAITLNGSFQITTDSYATTTTKALTVGQWVRVSVTGTFNGGAYYFGFQLTNSGDAIDIDHAQCEEGYGPTSEITTTSASVSRAGSSLQITNVLSLGHSLSAGTIGFRVALRSLPTFDNTPIFQYHVSSNDYIYITCNSNGLVRVRVTAGGVLVADLSTGFTAVRDTAFNVAVAYATNDLRVSVNGGAVQSDTSCAMPTGTPVQAAFGTSAYLSMWVETCSLWSTAKVDADLIAYSGGGELPDLATTSDTGNLAAWDASWVAATSAEEKSGVKGATFKLFSPEINSAHFRVDISDETNASAPQLGCLFLGSATQFQYNASYGATIRWVDRSTVEENDSGSEDYARREMYREVALDLDLLSEAEALGVALEMQRTLGTTKQVLFAWNPLDTRWIHSRMFLARFRDLPPLVSTSLEKYAAKSLKLKELL